MPPRARHLKRKTPRAGESARLAERLEEIAAAVWQLQRNVRRAASPWRQAPMKSPEPPRPRVGGFRRAARDRVPARQRPPVVCRGAKATPSASCLRRVSASGESRGGRRGGFPTNLGKRSSRVGNPGQSRGAAPSGRDWPSPAQSPRPVLETFHRRLRRWKAWGELSRRSVRALFNSRVFMFVPDILEIWVRGATGERTEMVFTPESIAGRQPPWLIKREVEQRPTPKPPGDGSKVVHRMGKETLQ